MLNEIVKKTKIRIQKKSKDLKKEISKLYIKYDFPFEKALHEKPIAIISEVKKASPSKGIIDPEFDYLAISNEYADSGVSAISVLTEPYFFQGSIQYLKEIANSVNVPVLRKDFIIDPFMIYEAKLNGASAILLIVAILDNDQLKEYIELADSLGLSALVEVHDKNEISKAINAGARIIGVNNRNLKDFSLDIQNSINLRKYVPEDIIFISESGIKSSNDIRRLKENKIDAVLIGEALMKSSNKKKLIQELKNG